MTDESGPAAPAKLRALAAALVTGGTDLISVGGIRDLRTACAHLEAGAALLQMHRALLMSGPRLVRNQRGATCRAEVKLAAGSLSDSGVR